jgi:hypothetical protein
MPTASLSFDSSRTSLEEAGVGSFVDEDVEVAGFGVVAVEDRAEETRVGHAGFKDDAADGVSVLGEDLGRLHGREFSAGKVDSRDGDG